ncbi:hypothetical protein [Paracoccus aestuariivivens]|uniref:Uncharacterized protein n=1 Tax=Paracoccus aestuariivivens TaxID=1820333 RepID=A0A6L6J9U8_9RHOB|nr:hypothetical protein [Paracoccus aestuariivivens]MTH76771.1 hypothetical protein [Paracoccus aestuariivivens]
MTKHIADKSHETGSGRIRNFTQQEREQGMHPSVAMLHARPTRTDVQDGRRVAEFMRIDRGHRV